MADDLIVKAFNDKLIPMHEYLLQGSVLDEQRDALLHRLGGLCDPVVDGSEKFHDHEIVYHLKTNPGTPPVVFRVRRSLEHKENHWHIRYVGQPEGFEKGRHTLLRNSINAAVSSNISALLTELGFRQDHEFVMRGYLFRKGRLKITVGKMFKIIQGNIEKTEPLTGSHVVELSVIESHVEHEKIDEEMKMFGDQLKPLIQLDKLDHRHLKT